MGILTRKQGTGYVIGSDRLLSDAPTTRPPKSPVAASIAVWTGDAWSAVMDDAITFDTLDAADEYVKANYTRVAGDFSSAKSTGKRRVEAVIPVPPVEEP